MTSTVFLLILKNFRSLPKMVQQENPHFTRTAYEQLQMDQGFVLWIMRKQIGTSTEG